MHRVESLYGPTATISYVEEDEADEPPPPSYEEAIHLSEGSSSPDETPLGAEEAPLQDTEGHPSSASEELPEDDAENGGRDNPVFRIL